MDLASDTVRPDPTPTTWSDQNTSGSESGSWAGVPSGATTSAWLPSPFFATLGSFHRLWRNWPKVSPGSEPTLATRKPTAAT